MLNDTQKNVIHTAYSHFLEQKGLKARHGQKLMIAAVARTLGGIQVDAEGMRVSGRLVCAVEAGTVTG